MTPAAQQEVQKAAATAAATVVTSALDHSVARALATAVGDENRLAFARSFTFAAACAYAAALDGNPPSLEVPPAAIALIPLGTAAAAAAAQFGAVLVRATPAEAVYSLGCIYTSTLPSDFRADHGVFYTPPEIVQHTLDMAERAGTDWRRARCLDPSVGGGAFLSRHFPQSRSSRSSIVIRNITSFMLH